MTSNSIVHRVLSLVGMIGSSPTPNAFISPARNSPSDISNFENSGEIDNPDIWSAYNAAMSRPRTLEEQLRAWEEMSTWDLMAAALTEITDEAVQKDVHSPAHIWFESTDKKSEEELNSMLQDVGADEYIRSQVWHTASFGNHFEKLEYAPTEGVKGFSAVHPMEMRRYWLRRNRKCIGYRWQGNKPDKTAAFTYDNQSVARTQIKLGQSETEDLWYPWDFMHIRRLYKARQTEHGEPLFEEAQGIYRKLRMAIDQMAVLRAQVQPDRYVVNVDVKDAIPIDQMKIVNRFKQAMRTNLSFGTGSSGVAGQPDDFKSFYKPWSLDTILWVAKPTGYEHAIDKLPGTSAVPDVYDIELLSNLFFSIIGMPKSWLGLGGAGGEGGPVSGKALLAQDMRFLRKIKSIRQPIMDAYTWLGYFHLVLKGIDVSKVTLKACMPPIGGLEDQMRIEILEKQANLLDKLADVMPKFGLPREAWVDVVFKQYMQLPDELVDAFITSLPPETQAVESRPRSVQPVNKRIAEQLFKSFGEDSSLMKKDLRDIMDGRSPVRYRRYRDASSVLNRTVVQENDIIVSGFGSIDPMTDFADKKIGSDQNVTERLVTHPGYKKSNTAVPPAARSLVESHQGRRSKKP